MPDLCPPPQPTSLAHSLIHTKLAASCCPSTHLELDHSTQLAVLLLGAGRQLLAHSLQAARARALRGRAGRSIEAAGWQEVHGSARQHIHAHIATGAA